jgi:hypothetical protein
MNEETWAQWFRSNFDKIILFVAWVLAMCVAIFLMVACKEAANIAWGREVAWAVLGAFLGLVTGSRLAAHSGSIGGPPQVAGINIPIPPGSDATSTTKSTLESTQRVETPSVAGTEQTAVKAKE